MTSTKWETVRWDDFYRLVLRIASDNSCVGFIDVYPKKAQLTVSRSAHGCIYVGKREEYKNVEDLQAKLVTLARLYGWQI